LNHGMRHLLEMCDTCGMQHIRHLAENNRTTVCNISDIYRKTIELLKMKHQRHLTECIGISIALRQLLQWCTVTCNMWRHLLSHCITKFVTLLTNGMQTHYMKHLRHLSELLYETLMQLIRMQHRGDWNIDTNDALMQLKRLILSFL